MIKFYMAEGSQEIDEGCIDKEKFTHIWYYYWSGCYEGGGYAIARDKDDKWYQADLGHCSCYGPEDSFHGSIGYGGYDSLEALWKDVTDEVREKLKPLLDEFNVTSE